MTENDSTDLPQTPQERPKRPILLLGAMLLCIAMGWSGLASGCSNVRYYQNPNMPEPTLRADADPQIQAERQSLQQALRPIFDDARNSRLPLSIANLLLSGLLVIAASRVIAGRQGAWHLAVHSVGANAFLSVVDYLMLANFRNRVAETFADNFPKSFFREAATATPLEIVATTKGLFQLQFMSTLLAYGIIWFSLSRPTAREYLGADVEEVDEEEL